MSNANHESGPLEQLSLSGVGHVIFLAGGGARVYDASLMYRLMSQELDKSGVSHSGIDGVRDDDNVYRQRIVLPSEQKQQLLERIEQKGAQEKVLIITQCLGTIAAMHAYEQLSTDDTVALLTVSPALPTPLGVITSAKSRLKRSISRGADYEDVMRTLDFRNRQTFDFGTMIQRQAYVPREYYQEIRQADWLKARLLEATDPEDSARVGICYTKNDWNTGCVETLRQPEWRGHTIEVFEGAGHSLNPSGQELPERLDGHKANVVRALKFGAQLLQRGDISR